MKEYAVVGKPLPRIDGRAKATGKASFTDDVVLPGMLHGKILRSPHPHARIVRLDTSAAERLPGVNAVVTGQETQGIRYAFVDRPGHPADEYPLAIDRVRYVGEEVAAVAAESLELAEEAIRLIKVEYEPLPAVFDPEEALKPGAPAIHEEITPGTTSAWEDWEGRKKTVRAYKIVNNVAARTDIAYGDLEKGFQQADYVREDEFRVAATAHAAMEPHAAVASYEPSGHMDVWLSSMGWEIKRFWLAKTLGLPLSRVRVRKTYVGGAFGGKINLFAYEFLAAFLSRKTGRPVKITLTREEVFMTGRTSHPMILRLKTGVKKDGTIVAQHMRLIADPGAYRGSSPLAMFLAHGFSNPIYRIPNLKHEGVAVYTNKSICCPKRGHGAPQARFAVESQLDLIAQHLKIDPAEIRLRNAHQTGDILPNGDKLESCGLSECIRAAAEASGWKEKKGWLPRGKGIGMGLSAMFNGSLFYPFGSAALIKLNPDGRATLFTGQTEFGHGAETAMAQIAAEELGLGLEDIDVVAGDSELCPQDIGGFVSAGVFCSGEAVRRAAADARRQLLELAAPLFGVGEEELEIVQGHIRVKGQPERSSPLAAAMRGSRRGGGMTILGRGFREALTPTEYALVLSQGTGNFSDAYSYTAVVAEVDVDLVTGRVKVLKVTLADDCGFPINPLNVEGQLESQAVMGQGDALFEDVIRQNGCTVNASFADYKIPSMRDIPEVQCISVPDPDPKGPFGAKEAGECARPAVIAAIANAVADAVGAPVRSLPMLPEKVLEALEAGKAR